MSETDERAAARLLDLPWPPGRSPFRIKGVAYRGHVEHCERFVPGGHGAVLAALGRPDVTAFFAQPFRASMHYDVFPLALAGIGAARAAGIDFLDFVRGHARWQANEDVHGVHRALLRLSSPEQVAERLPPLVARYFDFGDVATEAMGPGHFLTVRRGLPRPLVEWYAAVALPYVEVVLSLSGAEDVRCVAGETRVEGRAHGVEIVSFAMEAFWRR